MGGSRAGGSRLPLDFLVFWGLLGFPGFPGFSFGFAWFPLVLLGFGLVVAWFWLGFGLVFWAGLVRGAWGSLVLLGFGLVLAWVFLGFPRFCLVFLAWGASSGSRPFLLGLGPGALRGASGLGLVPPLLPFSLPFGLGAHLV